MAPDNTKSLKKTPKEKDKYTSLFIIAVSLSFVFGGLFVRNSSKIKSSQLDHNEQAKTEDNIINNENADTLIKAKKDISESFVQPYKNPPPEISAKSYNVINLTTNQKMFGINPDLALPPASVTKIMTALIALEQYDLDKPVVVPERCTKLEGSKVGFLANDVLTLEDVLYGLLVRSGADAACSIANIVDEKDFIERMNRKADQIGMENTSFANEIGYDQQNKHFSTVNDLTKLSKEALKYSTFRKIVGTKEVTLKSLNSARAYKIKNTNDLLFTVPGTVGIKTGFTAEAGECLVYLYQNKKQEILIIILGSEDRFGDTTALLRWAKEQIE